MENNQTNKIYAIAFIIILIIVGVIFFNRKNTENHYLELVSTAIHEYDSKANYDIQVDILDKFNEISVKLTPADSYTTNQYGSFHITYNKKSGNFVRSTSVRIPERIFQ